MKSRLTALVVIALFLLTACSDGTINGSASHAEQPELTSASIVEFYFYFPSGSLSDMDVEIVKDESGFILRGSLFHEMRDIEIDEEVLTSLHDLVIELNLISWNGFDEMVPNDDEWTTANRMFKLRVVFDDGTEIHAQGDHRFPDGYEEGEQALLDFFREVITTYATPE